MGRLRGFVNEEGLIMVYQCKWVKAPYSAEGEGALSGHLLQGPYVLPHIITLHLTVPNKIDAFMLR